MIWIIMTLVWGNSNAMLKLLPVRSFCEILFVGMRWEEPQQPWTLLHKKIYIRSMLNWQTELKQCVGTRRMRLMYCYVPFYSRIQGNSHAGMLVTVNWITHVTGCRYSSTFSYMRDMLHTQSSIFPHYNAIVIIQYVIRLSHINYWISQVRHIKCVKVLVFSVQQLGCHAKIYSPTIHWCARVTQAGAFPQHITEGVSPYRFRRDFQENTFAIFVAYNPVDKRWYRQVTSFLF